MLVEYKKDHEKIAMGLLSYLPNLRNLKNLQEGVSLYGNSGGFLLYLFRDKESDLAGIVGIQLLGHSVLVKYLSLIPGFRNREYERTIIRDLREELPKKRLAVLLDYGYLLKD